MYLTKKHKHDWIVLLTSRFGKVEYCKIGNHYRTFMFDYSKNEWQALPGNFLSPLLAGNPVFVMCKDEELAQFKEALTQYEGRHKKEIVHISNQKLLEQVFQFRGSIYLYGSWYELDLAQDPLFTRMMNGWI